MDPVMIMNVISLIAKGVTIVELLLAAGKNAAPALKVIKDLLSGVKAGAITEEDLAALEAQLDAQISDFNTPID